MKKILFFIFFISSISFSQDKIIEEIVVKNPLNITKIFNSIKKQLVKNCDTTSKFYSLSNNLIIDNKNYDYFINDLSLNIYSFDGKHKFNTEKTNIVQKKKLDSIFHNYTNDENPTKWILGKPINDALNIIFFDVFENKKDYVFDWQQTKDTIKLEFSSLNYYKGYIKFNKKTYNLYELKYDLVIPYPFTHELHKNIKTNDEFLSKWIYTIDSGLLIFDKNSSKISLKKLVIEQEFKDYELKRFENKNKILFEDKKYFYTKLSLLND